MAKLILSRHGESEFNSKGIWAGITDTPLTEKGRHEAALMGQALTDLHPDVAFTSDLSRAAETLQIIMRENHWECPVHASKAITERDYGDLTGKNKWDIKQQYGDEQFAKWRRGWNDEVPNGENLQDVYNRVVPYYTENIFPALKDGKTVLITAHGNSLRALIKYLEHLDDATIEHTEMLFGSLIVYDISPDGEVQHKEVRRIDSEAPPA